MSVSEGSRRSHPFRIVAGVDASYSNALQLLVRMRFSSAEVRLVHVVESLLPDHSFPDLGPEHPLAAAMALNEQRGQEELETAAAMLRPADYAVSTEMVHGDAARLLIECASRWSADLIAVGSSQKGYWGSLFFGSVTKALSAASEQSILVAKSEPRGDAELTAVLATDHSPYADACFEEFLRWGVGGIRHITVLTALDCRPPRFDGAERDRASIAEEIARIRDETEARCQALCARLRSAGAECDAVVMEDHPAHAIAHLMQETQADLVVLGARGHGLWNRLSLGSLSHFQVVATPHNVLVIRLPEASQP